MTLQNLVAIGNLVLAVATVATLFVLIKYTVETVRLRKEAQIQNRLSTLPLVVMDALYNPKKDSSSLVIRNLGTGPALKISVGPLQMGQETITFSGDTALAVGAVGDLVAHDSTGRELYDISFLASRIRTAVGNEYARNIIEYESVTGVRYMTRMLMGHTGQNTFRIVCEETEALPHQST